MSSPPPFRPEEFDERCETCKAPPGQLCHPWCDTGYTAEDFRHDAERRAKAAAAPGTPTSHPRSEDAAMPQELTTQERLDALADEVARELGTRCRTDRLTGYVRGMGRLIIDGDAAPCACASPMPAAPTG
ncbi:hypothetical protein ACFV7R_35150 [Streptomyces sp. NPDC059866]|uniref:hypothetical protein n=1 Tax=Streptomyces sp. NPDC059866 TaxID=3346978 RepID=UPI0036554840